MSGAGPNTYLYGAWQACSDFLVALWAQEALSGAPSQVSNDAAKIAGQRADAAFVPSRSRRIVCVKCGRGPIDGAELKKIDGEFRCEARGID